MKLDEAPNATGTASTSDQQPTYKWRKQWYPVHFTADLPEGQPERVWLFDEAIVVLRRPGRAANHLFHNTCNHQSASRHCSYFWRSPWRACCQWGRHMLFSSRVQGDGLLTNGSCWATICKDDIKTLERKFFSLCFLAGKEPVALMDRCPHRAAALSQGRMTAAGYLQCAYHGWSFDGETGACTNIPQVWHKF